MRKTKMEKGITLIALIITIVILLILAAVAISLIQDDQIFGRANSAATIYNKAQNNESIYLNKILDGSNLGKEELTEAELELMEQYILGKSKTGRDIYEVVSITNSMQVANFLNDEDTIADADKKIKPLYTAYGEDITKPHLCIYAEYNNKVYKIVLDYTTELTGSVEIVYIPEGREGTTVGYDGDGDGKDEDWIIITDRDGLVEIVSSTVKGSLTLGNADTSVKVTEDLDGDKTVGDNGDKAIASYNNVIKRINEYCDEMVKATDNGGVRSVGVGTDTSGDLSSNNLNTCFKNSDKVKVKKGDIYYEHDLVKMYYHGIAKADDSYLVASRFLEEYSMSLSFHIRYVRDDGVLFYTYLWCTQYGEEVDGEYCPNIGVRPVVINPSGI